MRKLISICFKTMILIGSISCLNSGTQKKSSPTSGETNSFPTEIINQNETIDPMGDNIKGHYYGLIWPVNYNLHFKSIGEIGIAREEDDFSTFIKLNNGPKNTKIKQALFNSTRCPNLNDDLNKDAYIDIKEAMLAMGKILIPFDNDLGSQMSGRDEYPTVNDAGMMLYSQTASFNQLFLDLKNPDEDIYDDVIKLKEEEGLTLARKIVLFQGVPKKVNLPDSVSGDGIQNKYETLPVGCAVLWKVRNFPKDLIEENL